MDARSVIANLVGTPEGAWLGAMAGTLLLLGESLRPGAVVPGLLGACIVTVCMVHLGWAAAATLLLAVVFCATGAMFQKPVWGGAAAAAATVSAAREANVSWLAWSTALPMVVLLSYLLSVAARARRNKLAG